MGEIIIRESFSDDNFEDFEASKFSSDEIFKLKLEANEISSNS